MNVTIITQNPGRIVAEVLHHDVRFIVVASVSMDHATVGAHAHVSGRQGDEAAYAFNGNLRPVRRAVPVELYSEFSRALRHIDAQHGQDAAAHAKAEERREHEAFLQKWEAENGRPHWSRPELDDINF